MEHSKKSIGLTAIIALVFIIVMGLIFPKNPEKYLRNHFWTKKTFSSNKYNLIVLGDSRVYRGIAVAPMEAILPDFKILNFGYSSGGLNPEMYKIAGEKLNQEMEPKVILLGVTAFSLTHMSEKNAHYHDEISRKKEEVFERLYLGKALNWFSPVTPKILANKIQNKKPKRVYINDYQPGGWVASEKIPEDTCEAVASYTKTFSEGAVSDELLSAMENQIADWVKQGVHVYAFRPPISQPMLALADSAGGYNQPLIAQKVKNAGGVWIYLNNYDYHTYDGSHLRRDFAIKLSQKIAIEIKKDLENKGVDIDQSK